MGDKRDDQPEDRRDERPEDGLVGPSEGRPDAPLDGRLARFLEAKRVSLPSSPDFEDGVMARLRSTTEVSPRRIGKATLLGRWRRFVRGWMAAPAPRMLWATACLGLAAAAFLAVFPHGTRTTIEEDASPGGIRIKGEEFRFGFVVHDRDSGMRRVGDGERLAAGDRIQVLYWLEDSAYVHLLSLDPRGAVQCYSCGSADSRLAPGAGFPLPFALELDAAPGWELFVLAASPVPAEAEALKAALLKAWEESGENPRKMAAWLDRGLPGVRFKTFLVRKGEKA